MFVEIGPHPTLCSDIISIVNACPDSNGIAVPSLHRKQSDVDTILNAVANAFVSGLNCDYSTTESFIDLSEDMPKNFGEAGVNWSVVYSSLGLYYSGAKEKNKIAMTLPSYSWSETFCWTLEDGPDFTNHALNATLNPCQPIKNNQHIQGESRTEIQMRLVNALESSDLSGVESIVLQSLADHVCIVVGRMIGTIDFNESILYLGVDSQMATQLNLWLQDMYCVDLTPGIVMSLPSVSTLTNHIVEALQQDKRRSIELLRNKSEFVDQEKSKLFVESMLGPCAVMSTCEDGAQFPASSFQLLCWHSDFPSSGENLWLTSHAFRLVGEVDWSILGESVNYVMKRHPVLRSTFRWRGEADFDSDGTEMGFLECTILPASDPRVQIGADLQNSIEHVVDDDSIDDSLPLLVRRLGEEACRPIDLMRGPCVRLNIFRVQTKESGRCDHVLLLSLHHTVFDAVSTNDILREILVLYASKVFLHFLFCFFSLSLSSN